MLWSHQPSNQRALIPRLIRGTTTTRVQFGGGVGSAGCSCQITGIRLVAGHAKSLISAAPRLHYIANIYV